LDKIAQFLQLLTDGEWHSLEDAQKELQLSKKSMKQIAGFLKRYQFATEDETGRKIKINDSAKKFLVERASA
jgi:DNA-binding IclR family transcriptional regulator